MVTYRNFLLSKKKWVDYFDLGKKYVKNIGTVKGNTCLIRLVLIMY